MDSAQLFFTYFPPPDVHAGPVGCSCTRRSKFIASQRMLSFFSRSIEYSKINARSFAFTDRHIAPPHTTVSDDERRQCLAAALAFQLAFALAHTTESTECARENGHSRSGSCALAREEKVEVTDEIGSRLSLASVPQLTFAITVAYHWEIVSRKF